MPANLSRKNSILRDDDDVHEIFADTRMSRLYFECVNYKNKREHMLALCVRSLDSLMDPSTP
jgi:hypothetical protein